MPPLDSAMPRFASVFASLVLFCAVGCGSSSTTGDSSSGGSANGSGGSGNPTGGGGEPTSATGGGTTSSSGGSGAAAAGGGGSVPMNQITDPRDGQVYSTVTVNSIVWMAENLRYVPPGAMGNGVYCYDDKAENCDKFGALYDWVSAMQVPDNCVTEQCASLIEPPHEGVCPPGWHIATSDEWDALASVARGDSAMMNDVAGKFLKATVPGDAKWNDGASNGGNPLGFSAIPVGYRTASGEYTFPEYGFWWTGTEPGDFRMGNCREVVAGFTELWKQDNFKPNAFSIRCVETQ